VEGAGGASLDVVITFETAPSVLFDALAIPDGEAAAQALTEVGQALEFVKDAYRHCKSILALGAAQRLIEAAKLPTSLPNGKPDTGLLVRPAPDQAVRQFIAAIARHRHWDRQTDPPRV
jgi:catalase